MQELEDFLLDLGYAVEMGDCIAFNNNSNAKNNYRPKAIMSLRRYFQIVQGAEYISITRNVRGLAVNISDCVVQDRLDIVGCGCQEVRFDKLHLVGGDFHFENDSKITIDKLVLIENKQIKPVRSQYSSPTTYVEPVDEVRVISSSRRVEIHKFHTLPLGQHIKWRGFVLRDIPVFSETMYRSTFHNCDILWMNEVIKSALARPNVGFFDCTIRSLTNEEIYVFGVNVNTRIIYNSNIASVKVSDATESVHEESRITNLSIEPAHQCQTMILEKVPAKTTIHAHGKDLKIGGENIGLIDIHCRKLSGSNSGVFEHCKINADAVDCIRFDTHTTFNNDNLTRCNMVVDTPKHLFGMVCQGNFHRNEKFREMFVKVQDVFEVFSFLRGDYDPEFGDYGLSEGILSEIGSEYAIPCEAWWDK